MRLPADAVFPDVRGLKGPLTCLNEARFGILWGAVGAARACWRRRSTTPVQRSQFGKPLAVLPAHPAQAGRHGGRGQQRRPRRAWQLGRLKDAGTTHAGPGVSYGKLANVRSALDVARTARTMLGGAGITLDHSVMRHMNNLETVMTYEGTEEMHVLSIGAALTGIPAFR